MKISSTKKKKKKKNVIIHVYVVPTRVGTFACTTLQSEFSVYSGKKSCKKKKKNVKNLKLINKYLKKSTRSRPITKVKQRWARIVLRWVTAWELRVVLAFFIFPIFYTLFK